MKQTSKHAISFYVCWEDITEVEPLAQKILTIIDAFYLEKPDYLKVPGHQNTKPIKDYLDEKIMKYFLKKGTIEVRTHSDSIIAGLMYYKGCVTFDIQYYLPQKKEAIEQLKGLFLKLIKIHQPYWATVHFEKQEQELKEKYEVFNRWRAKEHVRSRGLFWLNFWGPEELRRQGGQREVAKNKLARCTPLMQGLLIEVGDDPFELLTPEGEKLLMEASAALPEIELRPVPGA